MLNPDGAHAIACGADAPFEIDVMGHAGYYVAGMNKHARVTVHGNASTGAAENMMSGEVRIKGFASTSAGASAHGGCLIIEGDASLRCGISLKGARHRGGWQCRQLLGLHGAGRSPRDLRRCR